MPEITLYRNSALLLSSFQCNCSVTSQNLPVKN